MIKREPIHQLSLRDVTLKFDSGRQIFTNLNLDIPLNQFVWLNGKSGLGKSVLLKILAGLIAPTSGQILFNKDSVCELSFEEFLKYRLNIGFSFDFGGLINNRTLFGNLALPLEYHKFGDEEKINSQVYKFLKMFQIDNQANDRPSAVAGGTRKAICVTRALVHEPELLLMDDPTSGLRGDGKKRLAEYLIKAKKESIHKHIIIATEDEAFIRDLNPLVLDMEHIHMQQKYLEAA